jgi:hypothetical protein
MARAQRFFTRYAGVPKRGLSTLTEHPNSSPFLEKNPSKIAKTRKRRLKKRNTGAFVDICDKAIQRAFSTKYLTDHLHHSADLRPFKPEMGAR